MSEVSPKIPVAKVDYAGHSLLFDVFDPASQWRIDTFFSKEPETIRWIESFAEGERFVDIGANIGVYTILAATRGLSVWAFEPESQNYALLNRNLFLNQLGDRVVAYCLALCEREEFGRLNLSTFSPAGSCHSFKPTFAQGCIGTSLDRLISLGALPAPHHIKIDVDGLEPAVIAGARETLRTPHIRSVLVELNSALDEHWTVVDTMLELGFDYSKDEVERSTRSEGPFKGVGNYVFRR